MRDLVIFLFSRSTYYCQDSISPKKAVANLDVEVVEGSASRADYGTILLNFAMAICVRLRKREAVGRSSGMVAFLIDHRG